jgi:hypothetical protein
VDPYAYQTVRITYEVISTILVFILVRFMVKPYQLTRESRYLGLPLGFGFLGVTYALSAFSFAQPYFLGQATPFIQLVLRAFAFIFLVVTYLFSRRTTENARWLGNMTFAFLIVALIASFILVSIPDMDLPDYFTTSAYVRVFNLACIVYICAHTLRSHFEKPEPETIWIPFGYLFLAISQYSLIVWALDSSLSAFWGALAIRWIGLAVFLFVAYRAFYSVKRGG